MRKSLIVGALALLAPIFASAATVHNLRGVDFTVDTLAHYPIGPGAVYTKLYYQSQSNSAKHFTTNVIIYDMAEAADGGIDFRMHLGKDSIHTVERMTDVARRHADPNNHYLAAINGDFFITWASTPGMIGYPNMTACAAGEMAISDNVDHDNHIDAFILDKQGGMWCDQTVLSPKIIMPDNTTNYKLYGVNYARRDDARKDNESDAADIIFYNKYRGNYTGSKAGWRELAVELADGAVWRINQSVKMKVIGEVKTTGHMAIPRNGGVIAAGPDAKIDLESLKPGDIVKLKINFTLPSFDDLKPDVKECVGGDVTLLRNGEAVMEANRFINSRDGEYPRTMVGYNADRSKMVWCVVDGKTASNTGCSYPQGADMMKAFGCVDAINFDGGGSTMMWTQADGIVNTPSDGAERAVGSGFFAVLQQPTDTEIAAIRFQDWSQNLPRYALYTPVLLGYNKYGQLVDRNLKGAQLRCDEALGAVTDDGASVLIDGSGCQPLVAEFNGLTATLPVNVVEASEVKFNLSEMLIDNYHQWPISTVAVVGSNEMPLAPQALTWASDAPAVADVDDAGLVTGYADGTAIVSGQVGDFAGAVKVTVQCPKAKLADLFDSFNPADWKISGTNVSDCSLQAYGEAGMKASFKATSSRSPRVTIAPAAECRFWGIPEALEIDVIPSGVEITGVTFSFTPANDRQKSIKTDALVNGDTNSLIFKFADAVDVDDPAVWPLTLANIAFAVASTGDGELTFPRLQLTYPLFSGVEMNPADSSVDNSTPVLWFNLQGIRVERPSAPGIYIRRQGSTATKLLIK